MTEIKADCFAGSSYEHIMKTLCIRYQVPGFGFFQSYYNQDLSSKHHKKLGESEENVGSSR